MSAEEKSPFFGSGPSSAAPEPAPLYQEAKNTKKMKKIVAIFLGIVAFFVCLSVILVSVQAAKVKALFVLLLISLLSVAQLQFFVVFFIYRELIPKQYFWFIFLVGIFVIIQSLSTDIIVFTLKA